MAIDYGLIGKDASNKYDPMDELTTSMLNNDIRNNQNTVTLNQLSDYQTAKKIMLQNTGSDGKVDFVAAQQAMYNKGLFDQAKNLDNAVYKQTFDTYREGLPAYKAPTAAIAATPGSAAIPGIQTSVNLDPLKATPDASNPYDMTDTNSPDFTKFMAQNGLTANPNTNGSPIKTGVNIGAFDPSSYSDNVSGTDRNNIQVNVKGHNGVDALFDSLNVADNPTTPDSPTPSDTSTPTEFSAGTPAVAPTAAVPATPGTAVDPMSLLYDFYKRAPLASDKDPLSVMGDIVRESHYQNIGNSNKNAGADALNDKYMNLYITAKKEWAANNQGQQVFNDNGSQSIFNGNLQDVPLAVRQQLAQQVAGPDVGTFWAYLSKNGETKGLTTYNQAASTAAGDAGKQRATTVAQTQNLVKNANEMVKNTADKVQNLNYINNILGYIDRGGDTSKLFYSAEQGPIMSMFKALRDKGDDGANSANSDLSDLLSGLPHAEFGRVSIPEFHIVQGQVGADIGSLLINPAQLKSGLVKLRDAFNNYNVDAGKADPVSAKRLGLNSSGNNPPVNNTPQPGDWNHLGD